MNTLKIFCDLAADDAVLERLEHELAPHKIIRPCKPAVSVLAKSETDPALLDADVAFGQPDADAVLAAPRLRWVHVSSAGFTRYDTPAFREAAAARGLLVSNSSSVYAEPCAQHALAFMLAQSRRLPAALQTVCGNESAAWLNLREDSTLLRYQNVLILGFGAISLHLVEMLRPFKMTISAFRRKRRGDEPVEIINEQQLPGALAAADHVINVLPDNPASRHFMSAERFSAIKKGAIFYNIGRGTTVDQDALLSALRSGQIREAWLDVTDPEPLPAGHPLLDQPNCFITPHTAGGHRNESQSLVRHFLENFRRFVEDAPLRDRVI